MLVIDAHLDLSWNALQWERDLCQSVYTTRAREAQTAAKARGQGTVALPEMRLGRVALCFATMLARSTGRSAPGIDYPSTAQAYGVARGQLAYYRALETQGEVRIIEDLAALNAHMVKWERWDAANPEPTRETPPLGFVLSMEGADPILEPQQLAEWHGVGLRLLGPTHYGPGRYAGGTGTELGLTELGQPLLREMARLGVALDLTHLSDQAFWEALEHYDGPVLASHNNCRALVPHQRQFTDAQLRAIIERDGVIGAALDVWMLQFGWKHRPGEPSGVLLSTVADNIDYICQLAGDCRHVAIGSDLDGGFGREQSPQDLDTIADLQSIGQLLVERGYAQVDVAAVLYANWVRFLRQVWS